MSDYLSYIAQGISPENTITVVSRLGEKDTKPNIHKRRLHNIQAYLTKGVSEQYMRELKSIILTEGEPIEGFGQVEFYHEGRLIEVLKLNWNSDFVIDCYGGINGENSCAEDWQKLFYPCIDSVEKQK